MEFGKLSDISQVDFRLPPDPDQNKRILPGIQTGPCTVYVGCTGWSMKEWVGRVYPAGTRSSDYLKAYARQFNTIELNTTHYRIPDADTVDRWRDTVPADFRFCPKLPQTISHREDLGLASGQTAAFCKAIAGLDNTLGCSFLQLPPQIDEKALSRLRRFLDVLPAEVPMAIEFRHPGWFQEQAAPLQFLADYDTAAVITDVAGRRDVAHMQLTNRTVMVRFVGNNLHPSDYARIDEWVSRLLQWAKAGLEKVYFFTHEPDNLQAPELAAYLVKKLQMIANFETRGPQFFDNQPTGGQLSLF